MSEQMSALSLIPLDLQCLVLSFLTPVDVFGSVVRTNKSLSALSKHAATWRNTALTITRPLHTFLTRDAALFAPFRLISHLICNDLSPNVTFDVLRSLPVPMTALRSLRLRNTCIGTAGAALLAGKLKDMNQLTVLDLRGNYIENDGAAAIATALTATPLLTALDLSYNRIGSGGQYLAENLRSVPRLVDLNLSWNDLCDVQCGLLAENLSFVRRLTCLDVSENSIRSGFRYLADSLSAVPSLRSLNVSAGIGLGDDGCRYLAERFSSVPLLGYLDVSQGRIGDGGCRALANALPSTPLIHTLDLSSNDITNIGVESLRLDSLPRLEWLSVTNNDLGEAGCALLAHELVHVKQLNTLHVAGNQIGAGCAALARQLKHVPRLQLIRIALNGIDADTFRVFAESLQFVPLLTDLDVSVNRIGTSGAMSLASNLCFVPKLISLNVGRNGIGNAGARALVDLLDTAPLLQLLNLRRNGITHDVFSNEHVESSASTSAADETVSTRSFIAGEQTLPKLTSVFLNGNALSETEVDRARQSILTRIGAQCLLVFEKRNTAT